MFAWNASTTARAFVARASANAARVHAAAASVRRRTSASSAAVRPGDGSVALSLPGGATGGETTPVARPRAVSTKLPPRAGRGLRCAPGARGGVAEDAEREGAGRRRHGRRKSAAAEEVDRDGGGDRDEDPAFSHHAAECTLCA